jgi:hypothetical protein
VPFIDHSAGRVDMLGGEGLALNADVRAEQQDVDVEIEAVLE